MRTATDRYTFRGLRVIPATASADGSPWVKADTSPVGAPTVQTGGDGACELTLTSDNEAQNLCLYFGDKLVYDIDNLIRISVLAKITASLNAAITAVLGLGSNRNDDPDTVAASAWFKLAGSNALVCESDDGVTNLDDKAAGLNLAASYKWLTIDFATGVKSVAPPGVSVGGKGNVLFSADNDNGHLRRVADSTQFNMSGYSAGLQPYFQLQKTAATAVATLSIMEVQIEHKLPVIDA